MTFLSDRVTFRRTGCIKTLQEDKLSHLVPPKVTRSLPMNIGGPGRLTAVIIPLLTGVNRMALLRTPVPPGYLV